MDFRNLDLTTLLDSAQGNLELFYLRLADLLELSVAEAQAVIVDVIMI